MATPNNRKQDPRRQAMERSRMRVIAAGRDEQKQKKQQDRLARQEQKMAEKLERQKRPAVKPAAKPPVKSQKPQPAPARRKSEPQPAKTRAEAKKQPKLNVSQVAGRVKDGFQVIVGGKRKKILRWFAPVAALLAVVLLLNALTPMGISEYLSNVFAGAGTGEGFPVTVSVSQNSKLLSVGSDTALLGDSSLMLYKSNGKLLADRQHGFSDPAATANSARILVYDRGGTGIRIENRAKTLLTMEAAGPITAVTMADNGYFAVVSRGSSYISDVNLYNHKGKAKYRCQFASQQITAAALSENGRYLAVSALHVEGGESVTTIKLFDTKKNTTLFEQVRKGCMPVSLACKGTTTVAVLSDRVLSITKTGELTEQVFESGQLICFDNTVSFGTVVVLEMYQNAKNHRLMILDKDLSVLGQADLTASVTAVSAKGNYVAALADSQVLFYNRKAVLKKQVALETDARTLVCKGNRAIVLGSDRLVEAKK